MAFVRLRGLLLHCLQQVGRACAGTVAAEVVVLSHQDFGVAELICWRPSTEAPSSISVATVRRNTCDVTFAYSGRPKTSRRSA